MASTGKVPTAIQRFGKALIGADGIQSGGLITLLIHLYYRPRGKARRIVAQFQKANSRCAHQGSTVFMK